MSDERTGRRTVSVGTDSINVSRLQPLAKRVLFTLTNTSATQTISIAFGQDAVASQGVVLAPGGFYSESADAGFKPSNDDIYAVSSAAGGTLAIQERVESSRGL